MTSAAALAVALALTAGAYTASAIALLLGGWRSGNRAVGMLLVIALIAFAADRTYPPSVQYTAILTVVTALAALVFIARTRIERLRDGVWSVFVAVPAISLVLLASADSFAPGAASSLRASAVALFALPGITALLFYVIVTGKSILRRG